MTGPPDGGSRRPIRRLTEETVARIAAGEVVERPASVVKELVENAVDALATRVHVEIDGGGLRRIRVVDDGRGIPEDELALALERHATSKIDDAAGLDRIVTLGFRGEALAAIAAVARLTITSRPPGAEAARGLTVEAGVLGEEFDAGAPVGTSVEVRDLFYSTPARRKFLRSPAAELTEVIRTVGALHLARPDIGLSLGSDGAEIARFPSGDPLPDAAVRVLGDDLIGQTRSLGPSEEDGVVRTAVIGLPTVSRTSSRAIALAVNGRWVVSRPLTQAIRQAYEDYLPRSRFPVAVVHLRLDPTRVDINVHPTKREIRISGEREIADRLRRWLREGLRGGSHLADRGAASSHDLGMPTLDRPAGPAAPSVLPIGLTRGVPVGPSGQRQLVEPPAPVTVEPSVRRPRITLRSPAIFHLYWVGEAEDAVVLIDQHAASERLVYEALKADGHLARQSLVEPVTLTLTPSQMAAWTAHGSALLSGGFDVEAFGGDRVRVRSVPSYRGSRATADSLRELLDELAEEERPTLADALTDRTAATLACHAAVRAGDAISEQEIGAILTALDRLPLPSYACPHGRPITIRIPRDRLDRWFLRTPA